MQNHDLTCCEGEFQPEMTTVITRLREALSDGSSQVQKVAIWSLGAFSGVGRQNIGYLWTELMRTSRA
jgi:hypothetical protein